MLMFTALPVKKYGFLGILLLCLHTVNFSWAQGRFTDLGPQVNAAVIQGTTFAKDKAGEEWVYTVVRGRPAHLLGFDVKTARRVVDLELKNTNGSWDVTFSSDGVIYVAGANGHLFRHTPGSQQVEDLGRALENETVIWDLTPGKEGEIFGSTYPGCRVFRFHPQQGFSDVSQGPIVAEENYARSLEYQPQSDKVYVGVGSKSHLVELDPRTGAKREMLPEIYHDQQYIYSIGLAKGLRGGDRLFGWLTSSSKRQTLVYNLKSGKLEQVLPTLDVRSITKEPNGQRVYYTAEGKLFVADFTKSPIKQQEIPGVQGAALASAWSKNGQVMMLTSNLNLVRYDPVKKTHTAIKLDVPAQPIDIQTIGLGPDGRIWSGGYLAGGHAAYDPVTGKTEAYKGLDQTEGMTVMGKNIYFGIYPKARLYVYDTEQPWDEKGTNPRLIKKIEGQDRPFACLSLDATGKIYFGTVPDYGKLGGALSEYNPQTDEVKTFDQVVEKQSIVSLVNAGDYILGGTSISGGLGIKPSETDGKIFGWDPRTNTKLFEMVPVQGAMAITALMKAPDGKIWGMAEGTLFVFDPVKKEVVSRQQVYPVKGRGTHLWRSGFLVLHPSGQVYLSVNNELYQVDPSSMQLNKLADNVSLLTMDREGKLYFRRGTHLWCYEP